jgi:tRNA (adenine37-N6)-methyltransferase
MNDTFQIHTIGTVHASEVSFYLEILPSFRPALKQLDRFSHVMIFWWADKHDNPNDRSILQTELPYARGTQAGVFACRSEYRPNPIGVTICPILHMDEQNGIILLPWIDAFDGSPIIDLKPYLPISERVRDVRVAPWFADWPQYMEDAAEFFSKNTVDFGS